jgi:hypothetical protein
MWFPAQIAYIILAVNWTTLKVSNVYKLWSEAFLELNIYEIKLFKFDNIPIEWHTKGMNLIFNLTVIVKPKIYTNKDHFHRMWNSEWCKFVVAMSRTAIAIHLDCDLIAQLLKLLTAVQRD